MQSSVRRLKDLSGAVSGQLTQALASFLLQVLAARLLGAEGLGTFALLYSVIVAAAAICNGMVGDSLTVLPRDESAVRAALQHWCWIVSTATGIAVAVFYVLIGVIEPETAVTFAVATMLFLVETIVRRLLMAVMRFWHLALVDLASLVASVGFVLAADAAGTVDMSVLLVGLAIGQLVGIIAGICVLPAEERVWAPWRPAAMRQVATFGSWRGVQQAIRPTMLTVARMMVSAAFGRAAYGQLEAARVYMSPALLVVQGLGTYVFSSYARARDEAWHTLIRRADRAAGAMLGMTLLVGALGIAVLPVAGPIVTGSSFDIQAGAVFGWAVYAASTAAIMPYGSLAAVRGRQHVVVSLRIAESIATLVLVGVGLSLDGASALWAPYLLAVGSFADGAIIRYVVLPMEMRREAQLRVSERDTP